VALLLGLRHATDPDHLTALSTLVLSDDRRGARRASGLGLAWGLGHATTLFAVGLPVVLLGSALPESVQRAAETAVGVVIVLLAARLLLRWRRGYFHSHPHTHGVVRHSHPHAHEGAHQPAHRHGHGEEAIGRSPLAAYGIGLLHGVGGSAGLGILIAGGASGDAQRAVALGVFAAATAVSMALASSAFGYALASARLERRLAAAVPAFGVLGLLFGAWYSLAALDTVPYVL
jgi:hypothetical protein